METFHNEVLLSSVFNREDIILAISRINKHKELENAIKLPKVLGKNKIGKWMRIVGNMNYMQDLDYYLSLLEMVRRSISECGQSIVILNLSGFLQALKQ